MISADYVIVIEKAGGNYGAWCPDLPGVVALGETEDECVDSMRSAIAFHIEGLIEDGDPVPPHDYVVMPDRRCPTTATGMLCADSGSRPASSVTSATIPMRRPSPSTIFVGVRETVL